MVVNGRTWPSLEVEPRRYRFPVSQRLQLPLPDLKIVEPATCRTSFLAIGADGGFLPEPVPLDQLLMAPAERADVIVDFTGLRVGTELYLINEGPDEPF